MQVVVPLPHVAGYLTDERPSVVRRSFRQHVAHGFSLGPRRALPGNVRRIGDNLNRNGRYCTRLKHLRVGVGFEHRKLVSPLIFLCLVCQMLTTQIMFSAIAARGLSVKVTHSPRRPVHMPSASPCARFAPTVALALFRRAIRNARCHRM